MKLVLCRPAPSCKKLLQQATAMWPRRRKTSDGICGDLAHRLRPSDHNIGEAGYNHAGDLSHDPANGCDVGRIFEGIRLSKDRRVKYAIFDGRIFSSYSTPWRKAWTWGRYSGLNRHRYHGHLSVLDTKQACEDTRPWAGFGGDKVHHTVNVNVPANVDRIERYFEVRGHKTWPVGHAASGDGDPTAVIEVYGMPYGTGNLRSTDEVDAADFLIEYDVRMWRVSEDGTRKKLT